MKRSPLLLLLAGCASLPVQEAGVAERRLTIMGTSLEVRVEAADREQALLASERAIEALEAAEARLSTWREDTELARLNRAPVGTPFPLSPALAADLGAARRCWEETGGAFDPAVGGLVRAWGLRSGGRKPTPEELSEAGIAGGLDDLRLRPERVAIRERSGLTLEEGGFGKGAGLADALAVLVAEPAVSRAMLDLGGQVAVIGDGGDAAWTIPVADPRRRDRPVVTLSIDEGSVSTSGNSERAIVVDGERLGHILDPRSGRPAPDFGSLTVWTADPLRADCLSTGLYVMGPEAALDWAGRHPGVEVLVLRPQGKRLKALASPGLEGRLKVLADDVDVRFWKLEDRAPAHPAGIEDRERWATEGKPDRPTALPEPARCANTVQALEETIHGFSRSGGQPPSEVLDSLCVLAVACRRHGPVERRPGQPARARGREAQGRDRRHEGGHLGRGRG